MKYAPEFTKVEITAEDISKIRGMPFQEILKKYKLSLFKIMLRRKEIMKTVKEYLENVEPIAGVKEMLTELKEVGYSLFILSSNDKDNIESFLKKHGIGQISKVYSERNLLGKSESLKKILKQLGMKNDGNIYYVGDETRDIEAGKKAGVKTIGVVWGLNTKQILESFEADFVAGKPAEIVKYLTEQ